MKLCILGLGQAGGKILDTFVKHDVEGGTNIIKGAVAINTAKADLMGLKHVPESNRHLIGESRVKGHGVGADNELGAEVAEEDSELILNSIDDVPTHEIDAFLLIGGLGGGTGSGTLPVVAKHLKRIYTEPVYGLGILPGQDEGGIYTLNAARSFQTCVRECDNLLVFDNGAWASSGESVGMGYEKMNDELVRRLLILFGAGEVQSGDAVAESVVDASEIINTLSNSGVSTIGFATAPIHGSEQASGGLLSRLSGKHTPTVTADPNRIVSLVRKATLGRLTLPVNVSSTERALVIVAGPTSALSRKGIEKSRKWLEEETNSMEVRGGDYPLQSQSVAGLVLLSGVTDVPRIKQLQAVAIEANDTKKSIASSSASNLESLLDEGVDGDLDPLF
jgi:cell division GTPase FtsZ